MKTSKLLMIGMLLFTTSVFAKKGVEVPKVIVIGIGAKNPTFNEAQYPHLKFYYTPGLSSTAQVGEGTKSALALTGAAREGFAGDPKFLADANDKSELKDQFYVFDKNGLCYSQGYRLGARGHYLKSVDTEGNSLEDTFKELLKKDKVAKASKKEMKMKKKDFMLGFKMPEYNISEVNGTEVSIKSITEGGKPVIIVFFQLPSDIDIQEAKESGKGKSGKAFAKSMLAGASGASVTGVFEDMEYYFFDYDAKEK